MVFWVVLLLRVLEVVEVLVGGSCSGVGKDDDGGDIGGDQSINQREHTPGGALRRQPYDAKPEGSSGQVSMQAPFPS